MRPVLKRVALLAVCMLVVSASGAAAAAAAPVPVAAPGARGALPAPAAAAGPAAAPPSPAAAAGMDAAGLAVALSVEVAESSTNYTVTGAVTLRNNGSAPVALAQVATLFFVQRAAWGPQVTNTSCPGAGASGALVLAPGAGEACTLSFSMAKVLNGVQTLPGMIYARAYTLAYFSGGPSLGPNAGGATTAQSAPQQLNPPSVPAVPPYTLRQLSVSLSGVKASVPAGGLPTVEGTVLLANAGPNYVPVTSVTVLYVERGSNALTAAPASCGMGAPSPLPLPPRAAPRGCRFVFSPRGGAGGTLTARVGVEASAGSPGGEAASVPLAVAFY